MRSQIQVLDLFGLSSIVLGKPKEAETFFTRIEDIQPYNYTSPQQILAINHNRALHIHINGNVGQAQKDYFRLVQDQINLDKKPSPITIRNLVSTMKDPEYKRYLLSSINYGTCYFTHSDKSRVKAVDLFGFSEREISRMK